MRISYKIIGVILGVIIFMTPIFSQKIIPGYVGKKNSIGYAYGMSASFSSSDLSVVGLGIVSQHNLLYERVLGRKSLVTLQATFAPSKYRFNDYDFMTDLSENSPTEKYIYFDPKGLSKAYFRSLTIGFKFFRQQYVAPIGRYVKIQMGYFQYGLMNWEEGIPGEFTILKANSGYETRYQSGFLKSTDNVLGGINFTIGFGKIVPINDHWVFEFCNNFNFNYSSDYDLDLTSFSSNNYKRNNVNDFIFSSIYERMKWRHLVDFSFGLKYNF